MTEDEQWCYTDAVNHMELKDTIQNVRLQSLFLADSYASLQEMYQNNEYTDANKELKVIQILIKAILSNTKDIARRLNNEYSQTNNKKRSK